MLFFSSVTAPDKQEIHQVRKRLGINSTQEKNCEQMLGTVPIPVGYAGPLAVTFSNGTTADIHLPLATTEGALVASVNRGCKALSQAGGVRITRSTYHGMTRSIAFKIQDSKFTIQAINKHHDTWKSVAQSTSSHLKVLTYDIDTQDNYLFLTLSCDTDAAMGMNMVTIAAQAVGEWIEKNIEGLEMITVAGNVDSDKKPSARTHDRGRGYEATVEATIPTEIVQSILKTTPEAMLETAHAKLDIGSSIAGAIGHNLHAANIIAALYLATGQDAAHVAEGSLTDTTTTLNTSPTKNKKQKTKNLKISCRLPALLVGVLGGGTALPTQSQCLQMLLKPKTSLHPCKQLAESIAAATLAGELSLLAAQASHQLAKAHRELGR